MKKEDKKRIDELKGQNDDIRRCLFIAREIVSNVRKGLKNCPHSGGMYCNAEDCILKKIDESKRCGGFLMNQ